MERCHGPLAFDGKQPPGLFGHSGLRVTRGGMTCVDFLQFCIGQVIANRVGNDEITICQSLHQGAGTQPVGAVIGEIGFADGVEAGNRRHEVVIHPEAAHRVVNGRIDPHGSFIRVLTRYALVHVEKIAIALIDDLLAQAFDRLRKIQINAQAGSHTEAFVAYGFGIT